MDSQHIDLHRAIIALTCALDLVGIDEVKHGKRVAMMAWHIAGKLAWSAEDRLSILQAGMLHDCGVAKIREHRHLTESLEWDGAEAHCQRGEEYLRACPPEPGCVPICCSWPTGSMCCRRLIWPANKF